jgi:diguanylate cyclase (GGDEF)-like protein
MLAPGSTFSGLAYLTGSAWVTGALFHASFHMARRHRLPWLLLAVTASMWIAGDALERIIEAVGWEPSGIGIPDMLWLGSYFFQALAVNALIKAKGLPPSVTRDIRLDVVIVATTAALGAWHLLIAPGIGTDPSVVNTAISVLYPLGDVAIFSLALAVLLVPGSRGTATLLLVGCLGLTLPMDFLFQTVQTQLTNFDAGRLDAAFLILNSLLGAAALHPDRGRLTERAREETGWHLQAWRIGVLGLSLVAVSVTNVFIRSSGLWLIPDIVATMVISLTIIVRFYRTARSQETTAMALRELADHDLLTGAANRALLRRRMPDFITARRGLVIYIDLDGFKAVNDNYGHHMGDAILCAVTERLRHVVRESDTVARIGGDEFVILLHGSGRDEAPSVAERILDDLRRPVTVGACTTRVGASIGIVVFDPATSQEALTLTVAEEAAEQAAAERDRLNQALGDDILHWADTAMYDVKRQGGGMRIVEYAEAMPAGS